MIPSRVLIADDEIPYCDDRDRQTREALRQTRPNASDEEYRKGYDGMLGACQALSNAEFDLTIARRFEDAEDAIRTAERPFDVAIIDLGWAAQPDLKDRDTAGKKLVQALRETQGGRATRVIMYSSRFDEMETLAETACRLGTLPLLKTYTKGSHQTLVAATRFLASRQPTPDEQAFSSAIATWEERLVELRTLSKWCRILMILVGAVMVAGVMMLFVAGTTAAAVQASGSVLVTVLLGFVSKQLDARVREVDNALQKARDQSREMRQTQNAA